MNNLYINREKASKAFADYVANYNNEFYSLNMEVFNNQLYNFWNNEKIYYN